MKNPTIKTQPFDCMQYFYSTVQTPLIRCFIHFGDHIELSALMRAVDLSCAAVPQLGCCFDEKKRCWRDCHFTAEQMVHTVRVNDGEEDTAWKWLLSSLDVVQEPPLKLFLVQGKTEDTLCMIISHLVCDGGGFKDYLYLLAGLYSDCEHDARFADVPIVPGERNLNQLLRNLSLSRKRHILFQKTNLAKPDASMHLSLQGDKYHPCIVIRRMDSEMLSLIQTYAKSRQASINDMLLTAYSRVLHQCLGCNSITIPCPVDLRKYKAKNQICGICNLTSNYICHVDIRTGESFDDTLNAVSAQMRVQKNSDACLKGPMLFHLLFHTTPFSIVRKLFYKMSPVPVTSYTNLGILNRNKLQFGNHVMEDVFISTAVKNAPYFQLSISTFRDCCTMTSSFYGTEADKKLVQSVLDGIQKEFTDLQK